MVQDRVMRNLGPQLDEQRRCSCEERPACQILRNQIVITTTMGLES